MMDWSDVEISEGVRDGCQGVGVTVWGGTEGHLVEAVGGVTRWGKGL